MESFADQFRAFFLALACHALLIFLVWIGFDWLLPKREVSAAGEPIKATLQVSSAELRKAQAAIAKAVEQQQPVEEPVAPPPQPVPEPQPQVSETPVQETPQAPVERPDTEDQERISRLAQEQAEQQALEEQELRQRQEQVDLTEDIERQQLVERRQRLRELAELTRQREAATRRTRLEEQRMRQLEDLQAAAPSPAPRAPAAPAGNRGVDEGLLARYKSEMNRTADANWTHIGASELTNCEVRFTQIPGGQVRTVEFLNCPFGAEGREFVERALKKTPMPYSGFESVFQREVSLKFCYPKEECTR